MIDAIAAGTRRAPFQSDELIDQALMIEQFDASTV
jgi:hypothetical protein